MAKTRKRKKRSEGISLDLRDPKRCRIPSQERTIAIGKKNKKQKNNQGDPVSDTTINDEAAFRALCLLKEETKWSDETAKHDAIYTCAVANENNISEFIAERKNSTSSKKRTALKAIRLLKGGKQWSMNCFVCNHLILANKNITYDWKKGVSQDGNSGKYLVNIIRRHCQREHPETWLWNAVPETRFQVENGIPAIDYLLHQAMRAGGAFGFVPIVLSQSDFMVAFVERMASSKSWLRWHHTMVAKRLNRLGEAKTICAVASDTLDTLTERGKAKILSNSFCKSLQEHTLEQLFNKLMLFFYEIGRYKKCRVFVTSPDITFE